MCSAEANTGRSWRRGAAAALLAIAAVLDGCRSTGAVPGDDPGGAPADFTLDLVVVTREADPTAPAAPRTRAERFVLFPDGALHWGVRPEPVGGWLPPFRRTLEREQVDDTWFTIVGSGLFQPEAGMEVDSGARVEPQENRTLFVAVIGGGGVRWSLIAWGDEGDASLAFAQLADHLGELAWAGLLPPPTRGVSRRYDFGPDPYERYRP